MNQKKLSENIWKQCVNSMPIFGIDLLIFCLNRGLLMGRRSNNPAKDKFFVPGGRVYKNEKMSDAFNRILTSETNLNFSYEESISIGLYEHFYDVSNWSSKECSTHYIIEARFIEIQPTHLDFKINLSEQHSNFKWVSLDDSNLEDIHLYSKLYLNKIKKMNSI